MFFANLTFLSLIRHFFNKANYFLSKKSGSYYLVVILHSLSMTGVFARWLKTKHFFGGSKNEKNIISRLAGSRSWYGLCGSTSSGTALEKL